MLDRMDENAKEGLRFLLLGAGSVLLVRVVIGLVSRALAPAGEADELVFAMAHFRDGYLLMNDRVLVSTASSLSGRLALSAVTAVVCALLAALAAALAARLLRLNALRASVIAARYALVIVMTWFAYSALFLPTRSVRADADQLLLQQRPALFAMLSLPWPAQRTALPKEAIEGFDARSVSSSFHGCGTQEELSAVLDATHIELTYRVPEGSDCAEAKAREGEAVLRLQRALEAWLREGAMEGR